MPDIKEHIAYLSQEIGARPAGTEEEQQAALYITEQFQKEAGLPANIEDFNGVGDPHLPSMICCGAAVVLSLLSLFVPFGISMKRGKCGPVVKILLSLTIRLSW